MEIAVDNLRNSEMVAKSGENDGEQGNKNSELQIRIPESFKTPQKPGELDTDLQQLLNQRLQRSRSSSNKKAVVKPTPNRAAATGDSPNSVSSTPERTRTGQRYQAEWTTPGGQAIQFNFMAKNVPTTPEIVKRSSTRFPAQNYDAVWHNTSPWKPRVSSPLRHHSGPIDFDGTGLQGMHGDINGNLNGGVAYVDNYPPPPQMMGQHMNQAYMYPHPHHHVAFNQNGGHFHGPGSMDTELQYGKDLMGNEGHQQAFQGHEQ